MRVVKLLDLPKEEDLQDGDLPSKRFPSDHIRIQTELEIFS